MPSAMNEKIPVKAQHQQAAQAYQERVEALRARVIAAPPADRPRIEQSLKRLEKNGPPRLDVKLAVFGKEAEERHTHIHLGGDYKNGWRRCVDTLAN
jgi:hypothetical protein